jgi:DNA-binding transcriptional MerR regulator
MDGFVHIGAGARQLGVTPRHSRILERDRRIPPVKRDINGRVYSEEDIALLRSIGVGSRPTRLKRPEKMMEVAE